jgi:hypothetical protein
MISIFLEARQCGRQWFSMMNAIWRDSAVKTCRARYVKFGAQIQF